jgi:hypothetical protein
MQHQPQRGYSARTERIPDQLAPFGKGGLTIGVSPFASARFFALRMRTRDPGIAPTLAAQAGSGNRRVSDATGVTVRFAQRRTAVAVGLRRPETTLAGCERADQPIIRVGRKRAAMRSEDGFERSKIGIGRNHGGDEMAASVPRVEATQRVPDGRDPVAIQIDLANGAHVAGAIAAGRT